MNWTGRTRLALFARCATVAALVFTSVVANPGGAVGAVASPRLDLRVLLIAGDVNDATSTAWETELKRQGVAYRLIRQPSAQRPVTRGELVDPADPSHGFFNGVVLGTDSSAFFGGLDEVYRYEREYGVRQLSGFEYPRAQVGLSPVSSGSVSGKTASLTPAGKVAFPYLRGSVPLDERSYGHLARPVSTDFTTYASVNSGANPIVGVYQHRASDAADPRAGVAETVMTANYNDVMLHWRLLSRGMISWVTKGVHFGLSRNYLANQVDDVFVENSLWDPAVNCTPGEVPDDCNGSGGRRA